jgi:uncharacterized protein
VEDKTQRLQDTFREAQSAVVAFSGGTDSSLLLQVARDVLGDRVVAVTAVSPSLAAADRVEAEEIARHIGARHVLLTTEETSDPRYTANTPNRCFFCKTETYDRLVAYAGQNGYAMIVDGTNADDVGDHRPGRRAATERGVRSPLLEAGLGKDEIRALARGLGLPNWNKPAAACLSSRVPYGTPISLETLSQVERAEAVLRELGVGQLRVRHHGSVARIEVAPDAFDTVLGERERIVAMLRDIGYAYVALDLAGFRSGSLNETLAGHVRPSN